MVCDVCVGKTRRRKGVNVVCGWGSSLLDWLKSDVDDDQAYDEGSFVGGKLSPALSYSAVRTYCV